MKGVQASKYIWAFVLYHLDLDAINEEQDLITFPFASRCATYNVMSANLASEL